MCVPWCFKFFSSVLFFFANFYSDKMGIYFINDLFFPCLHFVIILFRFKFFIISTII
jgi:hypothetical protein